MSTISKKEVENALQFMHIEKHDKEYRIKGFKIVFTQIWDSNCVIIKGKIPLPLAKDIYAQHEKYSIWFDTDCHHNQTIIDHAREMVGCQMIENNGFDVDAVLKIESQLSTEDLYVTQIATDSIAGLIFMIEKIRETNIINAWAIGND